MKIVRFDCLEKGCKKTRNHSPSIPRDPPAANENGKKVCKDGIIIAGITSKKAPPNTKLPKTKVIGIARKSETQTMKISR
jgi:hypothetical protein